MKNRPQHSTYKPGHAGTSPRHITVSQDRDGYWHGIIWRRGPLRCLYSTGPHADQRAAHAAVQQWIRVQGWHRP
jgi:hypothetical protein